MEENNKTPKKDALSPKSEDKKSNDENGTDNKKNFKH
jgi:hypothetical protein